MSPTLQKSIILSLIASVLLITGCLPPPGTDIAVDTEYGVLVGKEHEGVRKFLGIPYAKAPTRDLRWQAPEPHPGWSGERKAYFQPQACVQGGSPTGAIGSQENCLQLNVWAPASEGPHPVLVWIHGGGFLIGSANESQQDGSELALTQDLIVVSMNYRLSYLGFLRLPQFEGRETHTVNGNQGLLDQLAALQWVENNIEEFGGDSGNITLAGESAGSISTCLLLASPLTNNLIDKAIMQSGVCDTFGVASKEEAELAGLKFLADIGCSETADPLECARSMHHTQIQARLGVKPDELFREEVENWAFYPAPSIHDDFLPQQPNVLLTESTKDESVAIIIGTDADEGSLFVGMRDHPDTEEEYLAALNNQHGAQASSVAALYPFADYSPSGDAASQIMSDGVMTCPSRKVADIWSEQHDVYFYHFTQSVSAPLMEVLGFMFTPNAPNLGTFHASEIPYVFGHDSVLGSVSSTAQQRTRYAMMNFWGNFARTGNPNTGSASLNNWPNYTEAHSNYMILNQNLLSSSDLKAEYCDYWQENPLQF